MRMVDSLDNSAIPAAFTFDDVSLVPQYSEILPRDTDVRTQISSKVSLSVPLISAAMDTVTECDTAIAMAQYGGLGIIHKNMTPHQQAEQVRRVKKFEAGIVANPINIKPQTTLQEVYDIRDTSGVSSFPVVDDGKLVGIITARDLRWQQSPDMLVQDFMTREVVSGPANITVEEGKRLLHQHRVEKLPLVDDDGNLTGLLTIKDIEKVKNFPTRRGTLRVVCCVVLR